MNPRQILPAVADRAAKSQAERRQHLRQRAAVRGQHHTGAQQAHPRAVTLRPQRQRFPTLTEPVSEFVVRRFLFGHHRLILIAVIAHRRTGNQHRRRPFADVDQRRQPFGQIPAAVAQARLLRFAPAFIGDRFAGQINDRVNAVEDGLSCSEGQ